VHEWNKGFTDNPANVRYEQLAAEIDRAIRFMDACGADFDALKATEFYVSHEALLFDYETPTQPVVISFGWESEPETLMALILISCLELETQLVSSSDRAQRLRMSWL
jgi:hypothetical protein